MVAFIRKVFFTEVDCRHQISMEASPKFSFNRVKLAGFGPIQQALVPNCVIERPKHKL